MTLINTYYKSQRTLDIESAGIVLKNTLETLQAAGNAQAEYTNQEVIAAVPEVAALLPMTKGEIHSLCINAGVEYRQ